MTRLHQRISKAELKFGTVDLDATVSQAPMLCEFVEVNGGRHDEESWFDATARVVGMTSTELKSYFLTRTSGRQA